MDAESVLFPRVFRGYERKSVNDFILKTNRDFSEETEELKRQIDDLSLSLEDNTRLLDEKDKESSRLREEIEQRKKSEKELNERLDSIVSAYESNITSAQRERDEAVENLSRQLDEIRLQLDSAKAERDRMIVEKRREEEAKIKKFDEDLAAYRENISAELRVMTKKVLKEILSGVDSMRNDLSDLSIVTESRASVMLGAIDDYEEEMKQEVRRILNDFNA